MQRHQKRFKNIVLVGMPGVGKSTLAKICAYHLKRDYVDTDKMIEHHNRKSVSEIFAQSGEDFFREQEQKTLARLHRRHNAVIAVGGGAPCYNNHMQLLKSVGVVIYVSITPLLLAQNLLPFKDERPLLKGAKDLRDLEQILTVLYQQRAEHYDQADYTIHADHSSFTNLMFEISALERKFYRGWYQKDVALVTGEVDRLKRDWPLKSTSPEPASDSDVSTP